MRLPKPGDNFPQSDIAYPMAEGVVHFLEMIQVQHKHAHLASGAAGLSQGLIEAVFQQAAVRQIRQLIMIGEVSASLDLVFQQGENHAHGDQILGDVPHLGFNLYGGRKDL